MSELTNKRKAEMYFRQALKKDSEGDDVGVEKWLGKAAVAEFEAIRNGERSPEV